MSSNHACCMVARGIYTAHLRGGADCTSVGSAGTQCICNSFASGRAISFGKLCSRVVSALLSSTQPLHCRLEAPSSLYTCMIDSWVQKTMQYSSLCLASGDNDPLFMPGSVHETGTRSSNLSVLNSAVQQPKLRYSQIRSSGRLCAATARHVSCFTNATVVQYLHVWLK